LNGNNCAAKDKFKYNKNYCGKKYNFSWNVALALNKIVRDANEES